MRLLAMLFAALVCVIAFVLVLRDLEPPESLRFAAGVSDGGYWEYAEHYREILARDGIELEILETSGSLENVELLSERKADIALIQGGVPAERYGIHALGTVFAEPVIVFARHDSDIPANPATWRGLRIARGAHGSGTYMSIGLLIDALGIGPPANELVDLGGLEATEALLLGQVDVAIYVAPIVAEYLQPLFNAPEIHVLHVDHIPAISLRLPHSRVAEVPSGALLLDPVIPSESLEMIVLMARLAAVSDLHPAVVDRLILAAREIHGAHGVFSRQGEFPTTEAVDMPLDPGALKLLIEGQSAFHDWLPYWIAAQIRLVLLFLLPMLFLVVPLVRSIPGIYRWSMRRRVWRHYRRIRTIEADLRTANDRDRLLLVQERLRKVDQDLVAIRLPPPFRDTAFNARLHLDLVARRLDEKLALIDSPSPEAGEGTPTDRKPGPLKGETAGV